LYFVKQKPAYEIETRLEFRRVLFRPLLHPPGAHLDHLGLDDRGLPQRQLSEPSALPGHEVAAGEEPEQVGHRVHSALGQGVAVLLAEIVFEPGRHSTPMMTSTPGSLESKSWKWTLSWDFAIHSCSRSRTSGAQSGPWTTVSSSPPAPSSRSASFSTRVVSSVLWVFGLPSMYTR